MDKGILIEYADMKEEIKDLRRRIDSGQREISRLEGMVVTDCVSCGKKGKKPLRTVKVEGRPWERILQKKGILKRRIAKMEELEMKLMDLTNQVEEYIGQIPKSELRILFRLYYIDDLTWVQVAHRMNEIFPKRRKKYTEDSCRIKHNRYFEEI